MNKEDFFAMADSTTRGTKYLRIRPKKLPCINAFSTRIVNDWNKLHSTIKIIEYIKNQLGKLTLNQIQIGVITVRQMPQVAPKYILDIIIEYKVNTFCLF